MTYSIEISSRTLKIIYTNKIIWFSSHSIEGMEHIFGSGYVKIIHKNGSIDLPMEDYVDQSIIIETELDFVARIETLIKSLLAL